ncbi:MAG: hypothetical protein FJ386_12050 [Verrucomicrobia bacterium]|nr:hypothetical protein [Verrucomicrobiota bacterium]
MTAPDYPTGDPKESAAPAPGSSPNGRHPAAPDAAGVSGVPTKELTPEEQMALYEADLKENDWGHQPC